MSRRSAPPAAGGSEPLPPHGILEELDGTPIGPAVNVADVRRHRSVTVPWWRAAALAAVVAVRDPEPAAYALLAFLARGGLLLLVAPTVVLPTLIGLANLVGPASVGPGGPGPRLTTMIVVALAAATVIAIAGTVVAAAAEAALHRASVSWGAERRAGRSPINFGLALVPASLWRGAARIAVIRLVLLVPVVAAVAAALPAWTVVAYRELTLPSDVTVPLLVRIVAGTPAASGLVVAAWLAGEVVGGFAARRAVLLDTPSRRALWQGLGDPFRAPLGTLLTTGAALVVSVAALAPAVWVLAGAWDAVRRPLVDEGLVAAAVGGALLMAAAWAGALLLAALAAAWRHALTTAEILRHAAAQPPVR
jgi:hypothetical protein